MNESELVNRVDAASSHEWCSGATVMTPYKTILYPSRLWANSSALIFDRSHLFAELNPEPETLNPKPEALSPEPQTLNPKPYTLNPKP